ncbi:MAG: sulfatase [Verrucomicrobiota bacterium]
MREIWLQLLLVFTAFTASADTRPNILFCMADDWGWPHASAYGDEAVQTPNFDRLAREGVLFHHAYTTSPSCTPSRNAVITGKYHWQLGPGANLWSTLPSEHESFIHLLADAGYTIGQNPPKTWGPGKLESWRKHHGEAPAGPTFKTFAEFLSQHDPAERPFFFWLATGDPHRSYKKGSGKAAGIDLEKVHLFEHFPDHPVVRNDVADYYFEVQRWDQLVGKAIDELTKRGLLENTIIVMTGDHGMPFPRGKGNLYDSGVRVPFVVRWGKSIKPGRDLQDFVSFADVAPTLLEASGTEIPDDMSGRSFLPLLKSTKSGRIAAEERPHIVFGRERHTPAHPLPYTGGYPSRGIRTPDFLYIRNYRTELWPAGSASTGNPRYPNQWYSDCDGGPSKSFIIDHRESNPDCARAYKLCFAPRPAEELYDLSQDPDQVRNVAGDPDRTAVLENLRNQLQQELADKKDPRASNPDYTGFDRHPYFGSGGGARSKPRK